MSPITQTPIPLSDEWATPKWLFDHFDAEFRFTLDGAAQPWNAKCARFYSPSDHNPEWGNEVVWLNPPYSELGAWMWKADLASRRDRATVVCLVPCVPDRKWWSEHVEGKAEVRHLTRKLLPTGRIHFEKEDGTSGRAPFASCIVIYRGVSLNRGTDKMSRYRKKPVVIEAEQFIALAHYLGPNAAPNIEGVCWCGKGVLDDEHKCLPHIHTLEGLHWVSDGDWIITGIKGEKYPCKPDIFEVTYEPV